MSEPGLHHQSVNALRDLITNRTISSRELIEHIIAHVDLANPAVNAVVTLDLDRARAAADTADADTVAGRSRGPLQASRSP